MDISKDRYQDIANKTEQVKIMTPEELKSYICEMVMKINNQSVLNWLALFIYDGINYKWITPQK